MRNVVLTLGLVALAWGCGGGATEIRSADLGGGTVALGPGGTLLEGSELWIVLDQGLDDRTRVGERVSAHIPDDVYTRDGELAVPRGAIVEGTVTQMHGPRGPGEPPVVALQLDSLLMDGIHQPIAATIVDADIPGGGSGAGRVRGRDVLVGAAAGALLGGLIEGVEGAIVGGALGAGAGTLVSLATTSRGPELPPGTALAIRLDRPVRSYAALRYRRHY